MEILGFLIDGFAVAMTPTNIGLALFGCFIGTIVGALPGLGPVNGVAILIPLAFSLKLPPESALILLTCVYYGCMYGGRISSIMLNIPGDEPAMMTCLDGYPMAQQGKAPEALAISGIASFVGAIVSTIGLVLFAPLLVQVAIHFGPAEYFALYVLAFVTIGGLTGANPAKTLLAAALGLALGTVGIDPQSGVPRFTFGNFHLFDGFHAIVAIVGLFAISEVLVLLESHVGGQKRAVAVDRAFARWADIKPTVGAMARGSGIGFFAGVLPGAGASLGSFLAYTLERRTSNKDGTFGHGDGARRRGARGRQQRGRRRRARAHAVVGRAGLGHHGGAARPPHLTQHHARPPPLPEAAGRRLGAHRRALLRQRRASRAQPAAGRHLHARCSPFRCGR